MPIAWLADMLDVIRRCPNLDWLLLTKRPENFFGRMGRAYDHATRHSQDDDFKTWLRSWGAKHEAPSNIWLGTSVENQEQADKRIPALLKIPAKVRFLSMEPLLSSVDLLLYLHDRKRIDISRTGSHRSILSGHAGACVETHPNDGREQGGRSVARISASAVTGGDKLVREAGLSEDNVQPQSCSQGGLRAPNCMDGSQSLGYTEFPGSQPQGRKQKEQPSVELGAGNKIAKRGALLPHAGQESESAIRGDEHVKQAELESSNRDSQYEREARSDAIGQDVQSESKDNFRDSTTEDMDSRLISWVIIGGESGTDARPCNVEWIRSVVKQCKASEVACFVKQIGANAVITPQGYDPVSGHTFRPMPMFGFKDKKGGDLSEWPEDLRVRQFPEVSR